MGIRRYLNFDLLLEQVGDGRYRARVTEFPLDGTPRVQFQLPFDAQTLEILLLKLDPGRSGTRRVGATSHQQAAMDFGGPLFEAVFTGEVALAWQRSLDKVRAVDAEGLRLRLLLDDAPAIAGLPWELLYDARTNSFIAQSERTPVVRFLDLPHAPRPIAVDGPLRVLVVISSPIDLVELDVEAEWRRIRDALEPRVHAGLVAVDRLSSATVPSLGAWLRRHQTHVVHFVGHGDFDDRLREGVLYFQDEYGRGAQVTSSLLGPYLRDHDALRMVVLNACRSARSDGIDPFGGMAQGLVQQDATAVVAMQFPISDRAAVRFTGEFYGALVDGLPVDQAVSSARKSLMAEYSDEWSTPVLYMRSPDGNIFENLHAPDSTDPPAALTATLHPTPPTLPAATAALGAAPVAPPSGAPSPNPATPNPSPPVAAATGADLRSPSAEPIDAPTERSGARRWLSGRRGAALAAIAVVLLVAGFLAWRHQTEAGHSTTIPSSFDGVWIGTGSDSYGSQAEFTARLGDGLSIGRLGGPSGCHQGPLHVSDATDNKLTTRFDPYGTEGCTNWTVVFTHDGEDLLMKVDPDSTENNQADFEIRLRPSP